LQDPVIMEKEPLMKENFQLQIQLATITE